MSTFGSMTVRHGLADSDCYRPGPFRPSKQQRMGSRKWFLALTRKNRLQRAKAPNASSYVRTIGSLAFGVSFIARRTVGLAYTTLSRITLLSKTTAPLDRVAPLEKHRRNPAARVTRFRISRQTAGNLNPSAVGSYVPGALAGKIRDDGLEESQ